MWWKTNPVNHPEDTNPTVEHGDGSLIAVETQAELQYVKVFGCKSTQVEKVWKHLQSIVLMYHEW